MRTAGRCPHCGREITEEDLEEDGSGRRRGAVQTFALVVGWVFLILAAIAVLPIALATVLGVAAWLLHVAVFVLVVVVVVAIVVKMVKWARA